MMSMSEFRAWLNEEWINGKLTQHQHGIITEHSILNPVVSEMWLKWSKWIKSQKR